MNWLDPVGACLSLICTFYFTQANRFAWVIGAVAIILNSCLYWQKGLYGTVLLESIYFFSMVYGFIFWSKRSSLTQRAIRSLTLYEAGLYLLLALVGITLLTQGLIHFTDSDVPLWDAITTVLSLIAQWLLCIKVIQCWFLWFVVDAMVAYVQFTKGIPFHSAIHWMYLGLAISGYIKWRKLSQPNSAFPPSLPAGINS